MNFHAKHKICFRPKEKSVTTAQFSRRGVSFKRSESNTTKRQTRVRMCVSRQGLNFTRTFTRDLLPHLIPIEDGLLFFGAAVQFVFSSGEAKNLIFMSTLRIFLRFSSYLLAYLMSLWIFFGFISRNNWKSLSPGRVRRECDEEKSFKVEWTSPWIYFFESFPRDAISLRVFTSFSTPMPRNFPLRVISRLKEEAMKASLRWTSLFTQLERCLSDHSRGK